MARMCGVEDTLYLAGVEGEAESGVGGFERGFLDAPQRGDEEVVLVGWGGVEVGSFGWRTDCFDKSGGARFD